MKRLYIYRCEECNEQFDHIPPDAGKFAVEPRVRCARCFAEVKLVEVLLAPDITVDLLGTDDADTH